MDTILITIVAISFYYCAALGLAVTYHKPYTFKVELGQAIFNRIIAVIELVGFAFFVYGAFTNSNILSIVGGGLMWLRLFPSLFIGHVAGLTIGKLFVSLLIAWSTKSWAVGFFVPVAFYAMIDTYANIRNLIYGGPEPYWSYDPEMLKAWEEDVERRKSAPLNEVKAYSEEMVKEQVNKEEGVDK